MIAQYHCELAEIAKVKGDVAQVANNANQALSHDSASVRATFILSAQAMKKSDFKAALRLLKQIEKQDYEFLPLAIEQIIECHHQLQLSEELLQYLEELEGRHNNINLRDKTAMAIDRYKGREAASEYLLEKIRKRPNLQGIYQLLEYKSCSVEGDGQSLLSDMKDAMQTMQKDHTDYQCRHCGFQANTLYWLCPSCHSWAQVKPGSAEKSLEKI